MCDYVAILVPLLTAVKFGRMSKKQREHVENEANFHKHRLSQMTGSSVGYDDVEKPNSPTSRNNNNGHGDHLNRWILFQ